MLMDNAGSGGGGGSNPMRPDKELIKIARGTLEQAIKQWQELHADRMGTMDHTDPRDQAALAVYSSLGLIRAVWERSITALERMPDEGQVIIIAAITEQANTALGYDDYCKPGSKVGYGE